MKNIIATLSILVLLGLGTAHAQVRITSLASATQAHKGAKVYSINASAGWDFAHNGSGASMKAHQYHLTVKDASGKTVTLHLCMKDAGKAFLVVDPGTLKNVAKDYYIVIF